MVIAITKTVIMVVEMMMMTILEGQHCLWRYKVVLASFKPGIATINVAVRTIIVTKLITTTVTTIISSITIITIIIIVIIIVTATIITIITIIIIAVMKSKLESTGIMTRS